MEIKLQDFVRKTIEEINAGLPENYIIEDAIDFEVSVTTSNNKSGGLQVKVVSGQLSKENELMQNVYFSVINEKAKKAALNKSANDLISVINKVIKKFESLNKKN